MKTSLVVIVQWSKGKNQDYFPQNFQLAGKIIGDVFSVFRQIKCEQKKSSCSQNSNPIQINFSGQEGKTNLNL